MQTPTIRVAEINNAYRAIFSSYIFLLFSIPI